MYYGLSIEFICRVKLGVVPQNQNIKCHERFLSFWHDADYRNPQTQNDKNNIKINRSCLQKSNISLEQRTNHINLFVYKNIFRQRKRSRHTENQERILYFLKKFVVYQENTNLFIDFIVLEYKVMPCQMGFTHQKYRVQSCMQNHSTYLSKITFTQHRIYNWRKP